MCTQILEDPGCPCVASWLLYQIQPFGTRLIHSFSAEFKLQPSGKIKKKQHFQHSGTVCGTGTTLHEKRGGKGLWQNIFLKLSDDRLLLHRIHKHFIVLFWCDISLPATTSNSSMNSRKPLTQRWEAAMALSRWWSGMVHVSPHASPHTSPHASPNTSPHASPNASPHASSHTSPHAIC